MAGSYVPIVYALTLVLMALPAPQGVQIPSTATALEGVPAVRIDSAEQRTTRRVLGKAEADENRLKVNIEFTYLSSDPGRYIRLRKLNDRISYVEHIDMSSQSVTYWGELRIVVGK